MLKSDLMNRKGLLLLVLLILVGCLIYTVLSMVPEQLPQFDCNVPEPSATFDCDDSALYMYNYFTSLGYEVTLIKGNLDLTNETLLQADHFWVWVKIKDRAVAYDWGKPYYDEQHYEGYPISYEFLLLACEADKQQ